MATVEQQQAFVQFVSEAKQKGISWEDIVESVNRKKLLGVPYTRSGITALYRRLTKTSTQLTMEVERLRKSGKSWEDIGIAVAKSLKLVNPQTQKPYSGAGIQSQYQKLSNRKNINTKGRLRFRSQKTFKPVEEVAKQEVDNESVKEINMDKLLGDVRSLTEMMVDNLSKIEYCMAKKIDLTEDDSQLAQKAKEWLVSMPFLNTITPKEMAKMNTLYNNIFSIDL